MLDDLNKRPIFKDFSRPELNVVCLSGVESSTIGFDVRCLYFELVYSEYAVNVVPKSSEMLNVK